MHDKCTALFVVMKNLFLLIEKIVIYIVFKEKK
ncbi:hypothetical protein N923_07980 [Staphylococcus aureus MRSA_CVMN26035PS]|nr:hypothetical protein CGSSa03_02333 [Staphylococcus aureus subsp. aureus CGS03]KST22649.1 hypothetical protein N923_07980 [Staphylococcus aureus MRSA_CVMN26035PS]